MRLALEQLDPEVLLERPDTMGNGTRRHPELACRLRETLVPPGHFEATDRFEGRSVERFVHGFHLPRSGLGRSERPGLSGSCAPGIGIAPRSVSRPMCYHRMMARSMSASDAPSSPPRSSRVPSKFRLAASESFHRAPARHVRLSPSLSVSPVYGVISPRPTGARSPYRARFRTGSWPRSRRLGRAQRRRVQTTCARPRSMRSPRRCHAEREAAPARARIDADRPTCPSFPIVGVFVRQQPSDRSLDAHPAARVAQRRAELEPCALLGIARVVAHAHLEAWRERSALADPERA